MSGHQERSEFGKELNDCACQGGGRNCTKKLFSVLCKETQNWDSQDPPTSLEEDQGNTGKKSEKKVKEKS